MAQEGLFANRGLDPELSAKMGAYIRMHPELGPVFTFEYRNQNGVQFNKYRLPDKSRHWIKPAGMRLQLWGIDNLQDLLSLGQPPASPLAITEGEFDCIAVRQSCPELYAVSVPNGANGHKTAEKLTVLEDRGFSYLWGEDQRLIPEVDQFKKIILFTDGDEKGFILRDELAMRIGETRCWFVSYPPGCKDANDVLMKYGPGAVSSLAGEAKPMRPGYMVRPGSLPPARQSQAYSTGVKELDQYAMFRRPELTVVTGIPSHGKTQFVRWLMFNLALHNDWRIGFLTPEDPHERLIRDMRRFSKRGKIKLYSGLVTDTSTSEECARQEAWIDEHFRISNPPDTEPITMDIAIKEMETAGLHHGCQVMVFDPFNEIDHNRGRETDTLYIEGVLRELKRHCRRLNMILVIVAHPRKVEGDAEPDLYHINGSANWRNKCDRGIIVWRPDLSSNVAKINFARTKDFETMGVPGAIDMTYIREECDFLYIGPSRENKS